MTFIAISILFAVLALSCFMVSASVKAPFRSLLRVGGVVMILIVIANAILSGVVTVPVGHVGVAKLFERVQPQKYGEGLHLSNPFYEWVFYDIRKKTHKETVQVPTQDQLTTRFDVSIQYSLNGEMAPQILSETGLASDVIQVHLVPKVRSALREQGKTVARAEDFFLEETQQKVQDNLLGNLQAFLAANGVDVEAVLLRDIQLPAAIQRGIEEKKKREQEVERQKAELLRYKTEQEQKVAQAEAERRAAEEQATKQRTLAEARAYEIEKLNDAIANNPAYIQLEVLKTLQSISKDPAAKMYFMDGDSPQPLPLMHMGEAK